MKNLLVFILSSLSLVFADHMCLRSAKVQLTQSKTIVYQKQGFNLEKRFVLNPGTTCQYNMDKASNFLMFMQKQGNGEAGQFGKYITYSWDRYLNIDGECVYDTTGVGELDGIFMDFRKFGADKEGGICKYFFYFYAANCGDDCKPEERDITIFTFEDDSQKWDAFNAVINLMWQNFVLFWLVPYAWIANLMGFFYFYWDAAEPIISLCMTPGVKSHLLYFNDPEANK